MNILKAHTIFRTRKQSSSGLTFIELIVVISIFALISSIVIFNFSDFSTNLSIQNISHDIALRIVQAQREAISGKYNPLVGNSAGYTPTYGVYFASNESTASDIHVGKEFIYFIDLPTHYNGIYDDIQTIASASGCVDAPGETECLDRTQITTGDTISEICVDTPCVAVTDVTILFKRPFPDAIIHTSNDPLTNHQKAQIKVRSAKGVEKTILITSLGQVSVK